MELIPPRCFRPISFALILFSLLGSACGSPPVPEQNTPTQQTLSTASPTRQTSPTPHSSPTPAGLGIKASALDGVRVRLWHPWTGELAQALERLEADFNARNPWGIWAEVRGVADQGDLFTTVQAGLDSDTPPHVVIANPEQAAAWNSAGDVVVDLSAYLNDPDWGMDSAETSDFPAVFWDSDMDGGERNGIPALRSTRVLFYNRTWAEELGFSSPPETPEEFENQTCTAARAINNDDVWENNGTGGWILDHDAHTILSWFEGFGAQPVGSLPDGYAFSTPVVEETLVYLRGLYDDGCAWTARLPDYPGYFSRRQALMFSGNLEDIPGVTYALQVEENEDSWAAISFPAEDEPHLLVYGPSFHLIESEPVEQLAGWLLVRWLVTPDSQAALAQAANALPVRQSVIEQLADDPSTPTQWKEVAELLDSAVPAPTRPDWRIARRVLEDAHRQVYASNTTLEKIPEILAQLDATIEEVVEYDP